MVDRKYFIPRPAIYYRDFGFYLVLFVIGMVWGSQATWPTLILPLLLAAAGLHRAGLFCHEIVHIKDASLKPFQYLYTWTVALLVMVPPLRFQVPHLAHHRLGVFGTPEDPQYPLVRNNPIAMTMVLLVIPFIVPFTNLFMTFTAAAGAFSTEQAIDRWAMRKFGFSLSSPLTEEQQAEVSRHARVNLLLLAAVVIFIPGILPFYYAVLVIGWALLTARIPLEHELEQLMETSGRQDQMIDSFTIESPFALIVQPVGFRFHTAHHMYPAVPYHNLPALHEHLKQTVPEYRDSIISLWRAIRGPKRSATASHS
ncbi:fatty acid desaturase family protein [Roseibium suaedae]|uniref:Fatty acid desaturase n=1 Tax=Roseibium suaedae TaxID=735517 RepID=A0A1M7P0A2_9HYPH|nr:fatty acid desaturase [Roseibium suaedae]SHN09849.1 Fatty acid desaturase [Roseibium suaedae]